MAKKIIAVGSLFFALGILLKFTLTGLNFFCVSTSVFGLLVVGYGLLLLPYNDERLRNFCRKLRFLCYGGLFLWLLSFAVIEGMIIEGAGGEDYQGECLIVLGAGLHGEVPSASLLARLETAYAYLTEHPAAVAVLSGGQGPDENITEAEAMRRYLTERGIDNERLLLEENSHNTRENLRFSRELLLANNYSLEGIAVLSNGFHLYRAKILAAQEGLVVETLAAPLPKIFGLSFNCYFREYFAVVKMYLQTWTGLGFNGLTIAL